MVNGGSVEWSIVKRKKHTRGDAHKPNRGSYCSVIVATQYARRCIDVGLLVVSVPCVRQPQ